MVAYTAGSHSIRQYGEHCGLYVFSFFSVYGASKAALKIFIESVNVELKKSGTDNRILNVSPGRINGTNFYNGANNLLCCIHWLMKLYTI